MRLPLVTVARVGISPLLRFPVRCDPCPQRFSKKSGCRRLGQRSSDQPPVTQLVRLVRAGAASRAVAAGNRTGSAGRQRWTPRAKRTFSCLRTKTTRRKCGRDAGRRGTAAQKQVLIASFEVRAYQFEAAVARASQRCQRRHERSSSSRQALQLRDGGEARAAWCVLMLLRYSLSKHRVSRDTSIAVVSSV